MLPARTARTVIAACFSLTALPPIVASDCNRNGVDDDVETTPDRDGLRRRLGRVIPGLDGHVQLLGLVDATGDGILDLAFAGRPEMALLAVAPGRGDGSFSAAQHSAIDPRWSDHSTNRVRIAWGDVDGDRDLDAALALQFEVVVLRSTSEGRQEPGGGVKLGANPKCIAAADLDGDGTLDFVTANGDMPIAGNLSALLNNGHGDLRVARQTVTSSAQPLALAAGDLDGDGDPDVALVERFPAAVRTFHNDGSGRLAAAAPVPLDRDAATVEIRARGVNADGDLDLVILATEFGAPDDPSPDTLRVLENDGRGAFLPWPVAALGPDRLAALLDVDGDLDLDVAQAGRADCRPLLRLGLNHGARAFDPGPTTLAGRLDGYLENLDTGDVDLDGREELVSTGTVRSDLATATTATVFDPARIGAASDLDRNGVPDDCQADCNHNLLPDAHDIAAGDSGDCDRDGLPDECEMDCDASGVADACELAGGLVSDCNLNGVPDNCEPRDADGNGVPDDCELEPASDCDGNGVLDAAELAGETRWAALERRPGGPPLDLDNDGDMDMLVRSGDVLQIHWGTGRGSFQAPVGSLVFPALNSFAVDDFDTDGDLDVAADQSEYRCPSEVWFAANAGNGLFVKARSTRTALGRAAIAAGDFDADRKPDLFQGDSDEQWFWRGAGDGTFHPPRGAASEHALALPRIVADLTGDGILDVATESKSVLAGAGDGTFAPGVALPDPVPDAVLLAGDLDGDGDTDLFSGGVLENDGAGGFLRVRSALDGVEAPALADFDKDGHTDALFHAPTFGDVHSARAYVLKGSPGWRFEERQSASAVSGFWFNRTFYPADWNGDGHVDVGTEGYGMVWNRGDGSFALPEEQDDGWTDIRNIVPLDHDGDGDIDLAGARQDRLAVARNDGRGSLTFAVDPAPPPCVGVTAFDLDASGRIDLVRMLPARDGAVPELAVDWDPGSPSQGTVVVPLAGATWHSTLRAGDLDADGDADLTASNCRLAFVRNDGSRRLTAVPGPAWPGCGDGLLAAGDLDGDLRLDFLARIDGRLSVLRRGGDLPAPPEIVAGAAGFPSSALAADLDGDGKAEVFVGENDLECPPRHEECFRTYWLSRYEWRPQEGLRRVERLPLGGDSERPAAADLDGDGDLDLLVPETSHDVDGDSLSGAALRLFLHHGGGRVSQRWLLSTASRPRLAVAADLTGDGLPEIAVLHDPCNDHDCDRPTYLLLLRNISAPPAALDRDGDGRIDDCEPALFIRGDWDGDAMLGISDAIGMLGHLFLGRLPGPCRKSGDADDSGTLDITDPVYLLRHLFLGGPSLPPPTGVCGVDETPDPLSCASSPPCAA